MCCLQIFVVAVILQLGISHEIVDSTAVAGASSSAQAQAQAEQAAGKRHIVTLHRQRVPVRSDSTGAISYKSVYFGSIFLGAPDKQEFSVVFDTGSGHIIVPSTECRSHTCLVHRRYNREDSMIAQDIDYDGTVVQPGQARDQITVAFGTGEITGEFVNDRFCLEGDEDHGASCMELRVVTATEMSQEPFQSFSFDGVLGLGLDSLALAPEFSFVHMLIKNEKLAQPLFGVFLADSDEESSEISFGGYSENKIRSKFEWSPVALAHLGYWQVRILALRVGNRTIDYCNDGECRAVVDTGTSLLAVPQMFAEDLQEELSALETPIQATSASSKKPARDRNCKDAVGPLLHFDLEGGITMTLTPGDYARQAQIVAEEDVNGDGSGEGGVAGDEKIPETICQPTLMPIDLPAPLGPKLFIWGEPVLKKYYTLYDWGEKRIGFALAKHLDDEDVDADTEVSVDSQDLESKVLGDKIGEDEAFDEWLASPTGAAVSKPLLR